jgi:hypothetical protein
VICTAPWKAWQTTERGLRLSTLSRTLHARSSCIIVDFLTTAWEAQILAIGDSYVRSYERRTVSVEWPVRREKLQALYHIRPTDGSEPTTVGRSARGCSQWQAWTASLNAPAVSSRLFFPFNLHVLGLKRGEARNSKKRTQLSTASKLLSPSSRLGTDCVTSKLTRMSNVARSGKGRRICS